MYAAKYLAAYTNEQDDAAMSPYDVGRMIADHSEPCVPEEFYISRAQIIAYVLGYITVNPSPAAWDVLGQFAPEIRRVA